MTVRKYLKDLIKQGFEQLFELDRLRFDRIAITREIIDSIIELAIVNNPKEFVAFFQGSIKDNSLVIDKLIYQQYYSSRDSATPIFHFNDRNFFGSVHSHPSYNNRPSNEDLRFFRKIGIVNCIICKPYSAESMKFYNHEGDEINIGII